MNTSRIIVRLDEEQRTAELEVMTPHRSPRIQGMDVALRQIGVLQFQTVELWTSRHSITLTKVAESDGSRLAPGRVMQILSVVQEREHQNRSPSSRAA